MEIKLTDFTKSMLLDVMQKRAIAVERETEALTLVFKSAGHELPKDGKISIDGDILKFTPPDDIS